MTAGEMQVGQWGRGEEGECMRAEEDGASEAKRG